MGWFNRSQQGINTETKDKKEIPEGLWYKCPQCKEIVSTDDHKKNLCVCPKCNYHERISTKEYFEILFDSGNYEELFENLHSGDPLNFTDRKKYTDRIAAVEKQTNLKDAISVATGKMGGRDVTVDCMNFEFVGGSMGSVVGEKIARSINYCIEHRQPLVIISRSGGARMMEGAFSLMQMAKTSAKLTQLSEAKLPYISLMTNPTTGGVSASFAMLGDINMAEPQALIGFAGPRVIREFTGKDLPEGFQSSEFLLEHGFLDTIVERKNIKDTLIKLFKMMM
ncbi:MAG: acetyl-CoA carboxylase carboxyltransferase subunit beta [Bacteroidales bacterium]|nr:acetyl-CoA carboxylase carboxyltransferase subunit beta [Bacteroidales bacterium]MBQ5540034.1 acetyl-CoA carboxylase carboxyltransferase subunit beta [Bacteroidales bacterium]MEE3447108.1 acetyl-CoA carboxylase, carboxyltransferase subunit beta [Bacteroidales bacterium]